MKFAIIIVVIKSNETPIMRVIKRRVASSLSAVVIPIKTNTGSANHSNHLRSKPFQTFPRENEWRHVFF